MTHKIISYCWSKTFAPIHTKIKLRLDIQKYNKRQPELLVEKKKKKKIKVVFFPINIGMWKNDYLFHLLQEDPRFEPCVISFFVPVDSWDFQLRNQREMKAYFEAKGYPYYDMYDEAKEEWLDINLIKPDIVFYTQAVNCSYKKYNIQALWKDVLFYYIPYCMGMEQETKGYNTLLFNICTKVFAPSQFHKDYWSSYFFNRGKNIVATGAPSFDYLTNQKVSKCKKWKCNDGRKRVIWAPHHSITSYDLLSYSNFIEIADEMLDLAERYSDRVEFVFKPHPRLRPKLEQMPEWGVKRTAAYYKKWEEMPNTNFVDGDYFDLFLTSDAMIHDCSTFMAEYLLTGKPVMFNLRDESAINLNEYAQGCYKQHYIGKTLEMIERYIDTVVLGGDDPMKEQRLAFVEKELKGGNDDLVAERIYKEIKKDLR